MGQKIHTEITKIAGTTTKDGTYYELQELTQYNEYDEIIPHYDGEVNWYRVRKFTPNGMPDGSKDYGPDLNKAYKYLKNRR